jgi:hypothetical protein
MSKLAKSLAEYHQLQAVRFRATADTMWKQEHDVGASRHAHQVAIYHERIATMLKDGKSPKEIDTLLGLRGRIENEERTYKCGFCESYHGAGLCPLVTHP